MGRQLRRSATVTTSTTRPQQCAAGQRRAPPRVPHGRCAGHVHQLVKQLGVTRIRGHGTQVAVGGWRRSAAAASTTAAAHSCPTWRSAGQQ